MSQKLNKIFSALADPTRRDILMMLLEDDMQAKFLIPMAVSLGFGILFATAITLILVPSLYVILEDIRNLGTDLLTSRNKPLENPQTRGSSSHVP